MVSPKEHKNYLPGLSRTPIMNKPQQLGLTTNQKYPPPLQNSVSKTNKGVVQLQIITTTQQTWAPVGIL